MPQALLNKLSTEFHKAEYQENPDRVCRVIVEINQRAAGRIAYFVNDSRGRVKRKIDIFPGLVIELPFIKIQQMTWSPYVKKIWNDARVQALLDIAVPTVGGNVARTYGFTGKDLVAAVIDTGIHPHPDLVYPENRIIGWYDLVNEENSPYDDNGHGTHIAGIIAGNGTVSGGRFQGMAPEAKLIGIKVLDREGYGHTSDVIAAIEWCVRNKEKYNIRVINLSLGSTAQDSCRNDPLCRATSAAWKSGIVVCAAAGNDGPEAGTINTPGINEDVITVGNLDDRATVEWEDDEISPSSSRGPTIDNLIKPDILAPGTGINSLRVPRGYRAFSGTSMATGIATGAVLQILQKYPKMKPNDVKGLLAKHARRLDLDSNHQGAGVINLIGVFEESKQNKGEIAILKLASLTKALALLGLIALI